MVILDDVVPDICVDAPQDPTSTGLQPPVELIVIPPTPEPTSQSGRSSIDGPPSPAVSPRLDGDKPSTEQVSEALHPSVVSVYASIHFFVYVVSACLHIEWLFILVFFSGGL